jgi:hypothetical protein
MVAKLAIFTAIIRTKGCTEPTLETVRTMLVEAPNQKYVGVSNLVLVVTHPPIRKNLLSECLW